MQKSRETQQSSLTLRKLKKTVDYTLRELRNGHCDTHMRCKRIITIQGRYSDSPFFVSMCPFLQKVTMHPTQQKALLRRYDEGSFQLQLQRGNVEKLSIKVVKPSESLSALVPQLPLENKTQQKDSQMQPVVNVGCQLFNLQTLKNLELHSFTDFWRGRLALQVFLPNLPNLWTSRIQFFKFDVDGVRRMCM